MSTQKKTRGGVMNLLPRKDYEKALNGLRELEKEDNSKKLSIKNVPQLKADTLNELIHEHFDNPPLEFEELKPNMWIWDNEMKEWIQIVHLTNFLGATKFVNFYINGLSELIDSEYEPNRFYRKEVVQE